jgi:hypothetical protein
MKVRKVLLDFARVVADQAERDPLFAEQIAVALGLSDKHVGSLEPKRTANAERPRNRRPAAVLDPIALAREGEAILRSRLSALSLDQLRDIVADYGMDHGKLVMKWKDGDRIADRIVELSLARAQKGDAFRSE